MTEPGILEYRTADGEAIGLRIIELVPDSWTVGWRINGNVVRLMRASGALRSTETMGKTVRALEELRRAGMIERRTPGPSGFTEWRRADGQARNAAEIPTRCQCGPESHHI